MSGDLVPYTIDELRLADKLGVGGLARRNYRAWLQRERENCRREARRVERAKYNASPEGKAKREAYKASHPVSPEQKERNRLRMRAYRASPEGRARHAASCRAYYQSHKEEMLARSLARYYLNQKRKAMEEKKK